MAPLAAICGVMIVLYGLIMTHHAPTDAQLGLEVTCFVGGLVLCFLSVVLARIAKLMQKLDAAAAPPTVPEAPAQPPPVAGKDPRPASGQGLVRGSGASKQPARRTGVVRRSV